MNQVNQTYLQWLLQENAKDPDNLCDRPIEYRQALGFLIDSLLGPDWYVMLPESDKQCMNSAVFEILDKYSKSFRREKLLYECVSREKDGLTMNHKLYLLLHPKLRRRRAVWQLRKSEGLSNIW